MDLSYDAFLFYVLRNGVVGGVARGRVERDGRHGLKVYSPYGDTINQYISGANLRSWCIMRPDGAPIGDWYFVAPEDESRLKPTPS